MPGQGHEPAVLHIDHADLDRLHPWLDAVTAHLPNAMRHAMGVALEEAVLNAATHGYPPDESGEITVEARTTHDGIALVVEDTGRAFDPTTVPAPEPPASLADAEPGGLGLVLLRHYCEHIRYERAGQRNRLTMRFPFPPA